MFKKFLFFRFISKLIFLNKKLASSNLVVNNKTEEKVLYRDQQTNAKLNELLFCDYFFKSGISEFKMIIFRNLCHKVAMNMKEHVLSEDVFINSNDVVKKIFAFVISVNFMLLKKAGMTARGIILEL